MGWWWGNSWNWRLENLNVVISMEAAAELGELRHILIEAAPKRSVMDNFSWPVGGEGVIISARTFHIA